MGLGDVRGVVVNESKIVKLSLLVYLQDFEIMHIEWSSREQLAMWLILLRSTGTMISAQSAMVDLKRSASMIH